MTKPTETAFELLLVDDDLVVVNKPAGLLTVPARDPHQPSLVGLLRGMPLLRRGESLRIVHRLDAEASGVVAFARSAAAQRSLVAQFAGRTAHKVYRALVSGYVAADGEVNLRIAPGKGVRMRATEKAGKASRTLYRVIERFPGHTLVECSPITGRTHQIRVHMAAIGHPMSVDPLYGSAGGLMLSSFKPDYRPSRRHDERPLIARLTLHALRLELDHPATGVRLCLEAPLPRDFRAALNQLRKRSGRAPEA